jgi:catechol 2,3-dioxygenase-like lactoylglutathione lyase family enzyme
LATDSSKTALPAPGHLGVVVKDLDKAKGFLSRVLGLGPWQVIDYAPTKDELFIGEPFRLRIAVAELVPLALELVQPLEGKSIWSEFLKSKGEGLHHIAFTVPNWDEMVQKMEEAGSRMTAGGSINGKRWCYFETSPGGVIIELGEG